MSLRSALAIADCLELSLPCIQASACIQEFPGYSYTQIRSPILCSLYYNNYLILILLGLFKFYTSSFGVFFMVFCPNSSNDFPFVFGARILTTVANIVQIIA